MKVEIEEFLEIVKEKQIKKAESIRRHSSSVRELEGKDGLIPMNEWAILVTKGYEGARIRRHALKARPIWDPNEEAKKTSQSGWRAG